MKIIPLKEGNFSVNSQKEFVLLENAGISAGLKWPFSPFLLSPDRTIYYWMPVSDGKKTIQKIFQKKAC